MVDTNIFISAALKEVSRPAEVIQWVATHGGLLRSAVTEQELLAVLRRPRIGSKINIVFFDLVRAMLAEAELVAITQRVSVCRDPDDDKFLELAVNGTADVIVSGDADLLALNPFRSIPIVTAAPFDLFTVR